MNWTKLKYNTDGKGNITLPSAAPFDGNPVLVKTNTGIVEAWWDKPRRRETQEGDEYEGFQWVCYDDQFQCELDDVKEWMPIPK